MKAYRGPPMTLESAAAAKLVLMVWAKHVVIGVNLTRPSRLAGTGHRRQYLNGTGGWFARSVRAVMWTWW